MIIFLIIFLILFRYDQFLEHPEEREKENTDDLKREVEQMHYYRQLNNAPKTYDHGSIHGRSGGLSIGVIVGIVLGVIFVIGVCVGLIILCFMFGGGGGDTVVIV